VAKRLGNYERQCLNALAADASVAAIQRRGTDGKKATCTTSYSSRGAGRTASKTVSGCVAVTTPATMLLTEKEVSRLAVIKREIGRGFAITMTDLRFMAEVLERAGL